MRQKIRVITHQEESDRDNTPAAPLGELQELLARVIRENNAVIADLVRKAIDEKLGSTERQQDEAPAPAGRVERMFGKREDWQISTLPPQAVKGFVHIVCPRCGEESTLFLRDYQTDCTCKNCGNTVPLDRTQMRRAYMTCTKCRQAHIRYLTNAPDYRDITVSCPSCKAPVALHFHAKKGIYETIF